MVGICATLAWVGANDLDKFVALVGSFACIPLVYIYPVRSCFPRLELPFGRRKLTRHT